MERVIIDCDPSADDGVALLLALASRRLSVAGITTVAGVAGAGQTTVNALRILELAGREDIPVSMGAAKPLCRPLSLSLLYGGKDGMSDTGIPWPKTRPTPWEAQEWIRNLLEKEEEVSVISIGPMTNLARLFLDYPKEARKIKRIYTASGCYGVREGDLGWKMRPSWNIWADPEAAGAVFASGVPIFAAGVDVTGTFTPEMAEKILERGNRNCPAFAFFCQAAEYNRRHGLEVSSLLVDAAAVVLALHPEWFSLHSGWTEVEKEESRRGNLIFYEKPAEDSCHFAAGRADLEQMTEFMIERIFT